MSPRHPGPVRSKSMARPPPLLSVCLVTAILHLVRSPRHLPPAARPPKAALCGAVGCRPHWQRRQSWCGAAVGSPPSELRPAWGVRPLQSLEPRICSRPHQTPPRQSSARTLDGRPLNKKANLTRISMFSPFTPHGLRMFYSGEDVRQSFLQLLSLIHI